MVDATVAAFGKIDILVNNAGAVVGAHGKPTNLAVLSEDAWDRVVDLNLKGVFLCSREVVPYLKANGYGKIINLSSLGAISPPSPHPHYHAAKAGVLGLTYDMAAELGPHNIYVNAIMPGPIRTPFFDEIVEGKTTEEAEAFFTWHRPSGASRAHGRTGGDCQGRALPGVGPVLVRDRRGAARHRRPAPSGAAPLMGEGHGMNDETMSGDQSATPAAPVAPAAPEAPGDLQDPAGGPLEREGGHRGEGRALLPQVAGRLGPDHRDPAEGAPGRSRCAGSPEQAGVRPQPHDRHFGLCDGRNGVGGKSPLSGGIALCQVGESWGAELKKAGFDVLIVEGRADEAGLPLHQ